MNPGFFLLAACLGCSLAATTPRRMDSITIEDIRNIFEDEPKKFKAIRNPLTAPGDLQVTRDYIVAKFEKLLQLVDETKIEFTQQPFKTFVRDSNYLNKTVNGFNFILTFKGTSVRAKDEPLIIIANYDTKKDEMRPIEDNGSGVAALLFLAQFMAKEIQAGRLVLKHSVVFAAVDISIRKYDENDIVADGESGTRFLAVDWLDSFKSGRKDLRGAIVLDSIMNYNDVSNSQQSAPFNKAFPQAYSKMAENEFKGNFIGLVGREDDKDKYLMSSLKDAWKKTEFDVRADYSNVSLLEFPINLRMSTDQGVLHFLTSCQNDIWNQHIRSLSHPSAILLTDTRHFRMRSCGVNCEYSQVATEKNLLMMRRVIMALYELTIDLQSENGASSAKTSGVVLGLTILGVYLRSFFAFNI